MIDKRRQSVTIRSALRFRQCSKLPKPVRRQAVVLRQSQLTDAGPVKIAFNRHLQAELVRFRKYKEFRSRQLSDTFPLLRGLERLPPAYHPPTFRKS